MIRVGIAEDVAANRTDLLNHLARYSEENGTEFDISEYEDGADLVENYRPRFDILFLDVEMARMDGLESARRIRQTDPEVIIIFVTNMAQYAIKGYQVDALSYLVKPVPYFAFAQELTRSLSRLRRPEDDAVMLNVGGRVARLAVADIVYVESVKHRITVHTLDSEYAFSGTLKAVEEELEGRGFYRSNNCYIVNLRHVTSVEPASCVMTGGAELAVSRPRRKGFLDALTDDVDRRART
ncbi:LytTR family DNA-binding domain-containing protein [Demequina sp. B12]|uniref:LytR/AlgR family response regulator transcription factor n=1 Tax=Demequina sp. B12 TaxID=2992757 RepID=UPI00237B7BCB|nr:LytTR family DNA-binding domain-containing protein [Demequina sp. B12]MDE0573599.1 LytTR family DNA-binding domain-containing protein [Demequina sp. B12]